MRTLASAVVFGSAHALRKVGMDILPDALLGATVGAWAALLANGVTAGLRGRLSALFVSISARRPYFWLAGLVGTFGQLSFFGALAYAPVSHVGVVASSEIVFTVLIAGLVAQRTEQVTRRLILPASLVFGGAIVIALGR